MSAELRPTPETGLSVEQRLDALFAGAFNTNHPAMLDWVMYGLRQALSSTPPPAVPLEDVKVLTMALQELVKRDAHLLMPYTKIAHAALKTFITKHPQLNS